MTPEEQRIEQALSAYHEAIHNGADAKTLGELNDDLCRAREGLPPIPIIFRGRNGWANLAHTHVTADHSGTRVSLAFYSRRQGSMPPILIEGPPHKIRTLLQHLINQIDGKDSPR